MISSLHSFIQNFKQAEQTIANFKERVKQLSIKNGPLKMFLKAYVQSEDADVALAAKIATLIDNGWLTLDAGDKLPDNWTESFDSVDDNEAYLHFIQRIGNGYEGQTLMVQFKGDKIGIISYMDGFTMGLPQSKGKSHD